MTLRVSLASEIVTCFVNSRIFYKFDILESIAYVRTHVCGVMCHLLLVCGKKRLKYHSINAIVICGFRLALGCLTASIDEWLGFQSCAWR